MEQRFVASWSGGKDSAMAYYRAMQKGYIPATIWTMFEIDEEYSKSHSIPRAIVEAQATSLNVPLAIRGADWDTYEEQFLHVMDECRQNGMELAVFGDIDIENHRSWVQNACEKVGIEAVHPLWQEPRRKLLEQFVVAGFEAYVIVVHTEKMPARFVGRKFTIELMDELDALGIDSCGELGEFHTVVVDGPIFSRRIPIQFGEVVYESNYARIEIFGEGK